LIGIVSLPAASPSALPAVIFLNSGMVHRVGPNRLYVRLARAFAARGYPSLRFDLSGIGDSAASASPEAPPARWVGEALAAMQEMERHGCSRFILLGNCMGGSIAGLTALADERVVGLAMLNPQVPASPRHALRLMLSQPSSWRRLFSGRITPRKILSEMSSKLLTSAHKGSAAPAAGSGTPDPGAALRRLAERGVELLLIACEWDASYDFLAHGGKRVLGDSAVRPRVTTGVIRGADHQFTLIDSQVQLLAAVDAWSARQADRWR
jgi:pimeloyl-ACP methyl ester carboxylesterase